MFSVEHLNTLRAYEIEQIIERLPRGARVLEIGAGTGRQALELERRGFDVEAVEMAGSNYAHDRLRRITDYDGRHLPFANRTFDVVFSSNVLEHVVDLPQMHREIRRVLRPGGSCIHVLPTHVWRTWTTLTLFAEALQCVQAQSPGPLMRWPAAAWWRAARMVGSAFKPKRHGERGNALSETIYFHPRWWRQNFRAHGFVVRREQPIGLFYTGHMILGARCSIETRQRLARILGSACQLYELAVAAPQDSGYRFD